MRKCIQKYFYISPDPSDSNYNGNLMLKDQWYTFSKTFTASGNYKWITIGNFVYENWDWIGGLSFLPRSEHVYQLAPYEAVTKEEYERRTKAIGKIDFSKLYKA